jgi:hypothetical protein
MLAFAGIIGYASISAYQRNCAAKKVLSRTKTDGYSNVMVIYKSRWLCPNLEATVIGFKDNYISDGNKNKLLNDALHSDNSADIIDGLKQFKSETVMERTAIDLVSSGNATDVVDGTVLYKERNWVGPALLPGGLSVFKYKRSPTTNELAWNGSCRTWGNRTETRTVNANVTYNNTTTPLSQPPPQ